MPLGVDCPACQHQFLVPDKMAGRPVKCPRCEHSFTAQSGTLAGGSHPEVRLPPLHPAPVPVAQVVQPSATTLPLAHVMEAQPSQNPASLPAPLPLEQSPTPVAATLAPPAPERPPLARVDAVRPVSPAAPAARPQRRGLTRLVLDLPGAVMDNVARPMQGIVALAVLGLISGLGACALVGPAREPMMGLAVAALGLLFAGVAIVALLRRDEKGYGLPVAAALVNLQALVFALVTPGALPSTEVDAQANKPVPANAIAQLRQALKNPDSAERMNAAYAVGGLARDLNQAVQELTALLRNNEPKVKIAAAEALGLIGAQARIAYPVLADVARSDADENVRKRAQEAMDKIGPPTLGDAMALQDALKDRKKGKQLRAAAALGLMLARSDDRSSLKTLEDALKDNEPLVRVCAARALWGLSGRQVDGLSDVLVGGLKDVDPEVKAEAAQALFFMGPDARKAALQLEICLGDSDVRVRQRAAMALWAIGPAANAPVARLIEALKDRDAKVRIYSALALWTIARQKDGIPVLCEYVKNPDPLFRLTAVKALYNICTEARASQIAVSGKDKSGPKTQIVDAVPWLIDALRDTDGDVRGIAALTLGVLGKDAKQAVPRLIEALKDSKDATFRAEVAHAFVGMGKDASDAVPALTEALKDRDNTVRVFAAQSLWAIEGKASAMVPTLTKVLAEDPDANVRAKAAFGLGALREEAKTAVPALNAALRDSNPLLRLAAAAALGKIGQEARVAYPTLDQLVKEEKQAEVKKAATEAMKKIGRPVKADVATLLIPALKHNNPNYRATAAVCLWMLYRDAREATLPLADALSDPDEQVRGTAASALGAIGPEAVEAVPALTRALENKNDDFLRMRAAYALGEIGEKAQKAVPALRTALKDKNPGVRLHAAQALWSIQAQPKDVLSALTRLLEEKELDNSLLVTAIETLTKAAAKNGKDPAVAEILRKRTLPALSKAMSDPDEALQLTAIAAMGLMGLEGREGVPRLMDMLLEPDPAVRYAAIDALMHIAEAERQAKVGVRAKVAFPALYIASRADGNESVRQRASMALVKIGELGAEDVPELLAIMGDKNLPLTYRSAAGQALSVVGSEAKDFVEPMCKLLASDEPALRALVATALGDLRKAGEKAIGPLVEALKTDEVPVRLAVVQALGEIGPFFPTLCRPAVAAVAARDEDETVRAAARQALKKIGPGAK